MKNQLIIILLILFFAGCIETGPQPLSDYGGWLIIGNYATTSTMGNYYEVDIQKGNEVKTVETYEYYWYKYRIGDVIDDSPTIKDTIFGYPGSSVGLGVSAGRNYNDTIVVYDTIYINEKFNPTTTYFDTTIVSFGMRY